MTRKYKSNPRKRRNAIAHLPPGTKVGAGRWPYDTGTPWKGTVLADDDPRSWAGTMAFEGHKSPSRAEIRKHLAWIERQRGLTMKDQAPVEWDFGDSKRVYWERGPASKRRGSKRYALRPYAEDVEMQREYLRKRNPRGDKRRRNAGRSSHQMAADIAAAAHRAMMRHSYHRWYLGFVPSKMAKDGSRILKAGAFYIGTDEAAKPAGYEYIMPLPAHLDQNQLKNRLLKIVGRIPVLGPAGEEPRVVVERIGGRGSAKRGNPRGNPAVKTARGARSDDAIHKAIRSANRYAGTYNQVMRQALATHGDHGPFISGVGRSHFPQHTKTVLRGLMDKYNDAQEKIAAEFKKLWPRTDFYHSKRSKTYRDTMVRAGHYGTGSKRRRSRR